MARAAASLGEPVAALSGRSRVRAICQARWAVVIVLRETGLSYPRIGKRLGGRDHSTIIHAERKGRELLTTSGDFVALVDELRALMAGEHPPRLDLGGLPGAGRLRRPRGLRSYDCEEREEEEDRRKIARGSAALLCALSNYNVVIGAGAGA